MPLFRLTITGLGLAYRGLKTTMDNKPKRRYEPSRVVVNMGVLLGGAVGLLLTWQLALDGVQAFLLTGFCALMGVTVLGYTEVFVIRPRRS